MLRWMDPPVPEHRAGMQGEDAHTYSQLEGCSDTFGQRSDPMHTQRTDAKRGAGASSVARKTVERRRRRDLCSCWRLANHKANQQEMRRTHGDNAGAAGQRTPRLMTQTTSLPFSLPSLISGMRTWERNTSARHGRGKAVVLRMAETARSAAAEPPIAPADAAIRWIAAHSALSASAGDGVILGATSAPQLAQTLAAAVAAEPLPQAVLEALDASWTDCATSSPGYFR